MIPSVHRPFLLCLLLAAPALTAHAAAPPDHWVGTWAAAPMASSNIRRPSTATSPGAPPTILPAAPAPGTPRLIDQNFGATDTTFREIVHVSLGGPMVRVVLTNEFGTDPLTIGAAHIAVSQGNSTINLVTAGGLTFAGHVSVAIPPGALVVSDPVAMKLPAGADLAVSIFIPAQPMSVVTQHGFAGQTSYTAPGNVVGAKALEAPAEIKSWPFLKGVDVLLAGDSGAIVAFGDSITDGAQSTINANARWPDELARRLQADKKTANLGVLNQGIGGNCVLHDCTGPNALARFDRDVIAQAGVRYIILLESINDIGHATEPAKRFDISADELILGFTQLIDRAHMHGIKVIGATLTPVAKSKYDSPAEETIRQAINQWVRTTPLLDGFVDFDKATQDPANPTMFLPAYDSGDHLHPKDAGYKAMGDAIDLKLFAK